MPPAHPLGARLSLVGRGTGDELLEQFLGYVDDLGLSLYPAQEEAILEIMGGKHVIVATPTGSGKSLIAFAMIFRALANGGRAFYTCPVKALVNEKFFQLTDAFGPEMVGMMTGDATVNAEAPIIACTAEIAASMALRQGTGAPIDALVMDEFHYYADRDRGAAWHVPLLLLARTHFLLMSATLGDATPFVARLKALTGRDAVLVEGRDRPVPLDFTYCEEPLTETVRDVVAQGKAPVYVVCFTQRACAEEAQNLMSENYASKEEKRSILEAMVDKSFDSPYGKEVARFLKHGIALHHAGLLPKYRLLAEKLAQDGLLKIICGTDTLGVGVNIPIRTVLFTKLCKFDGEKTSLLTVREFQQIAGRAGRKGFDDKGSVIVQAPEHAIENKKIDRKKESDPKKYKNLQRAKPPTKGFVNWDRATFDRLVGGKPEELVARFTIDHGMLVDLLDNPEAGKRGGYGMLLDLIDKAHVSDRDKRRERKHAPLLFRSLLRAGVIALEERPGKRGKRAIVSQDLQRDFSLMHALSLWLVDYVGVLADTVEDEAAYAVAVLSAVEAILESPRVILERQVDKLKGEKIAELKAAGVEYEERMAELEKVEYVKPDAEAIYETFNAFVKQHPWAGTENIRPKSIARDLFERYATFDEYVREYDLSRVEGVLLRYLSDVVKTLEQNVPDALKTPAFDDLYYFLKDEVRGVDSSLLTEWEERKNGGAKRQRAVEERPLHEDPKAFGAWARREVHKLLARLAARDFEGAAALAGTETMDAAAIERAVATYFEARKTLSVQHAARTSDKTLLRDLGGAQFELVQTLVDPDADDDWVLVADVVLGETPRLALRAIQPG